MAGPKSVLEVVLVRVAPHNRSFAVVLIFGMQTA